MVIYWLLMAVILLNGLFFGKKRKWFICSTFFLMTLVAALRSSDVGIDLAGHYARFYEMIAVSGWKDIPELIEFTGYDPGLIAFCKLISYISSSPMCFIVVSSILIYVSVGVYIYRYSDDVVLETFMFLAMMFYFMYMNIIAQSMAIAIILWAIKYMNEKKYIKFILLVALATLFHSSALFAMIFILLSCLKVKKGIVVGYAFACIGAVIGFKKIVEIFTKTIFRQFLRYFENSVFESGQELSLYTFLYMMLFVMCLVFGLLFIYTKKTIEDEPIRYFKKKGDVYGVVQTNSNFLIYMTLTALVFRVVSTQMYIISRMGYYTFFFAPTLLTRSISKVSPRERLILKTLVYVIMITFFVLFAEDAGGKSYGVVPYKFFGE